MTTQDLGKAVGHATNDIAVSWNKRDLLTYAVGVGAKADDLPLVYELHPNFAPIPTYPVVLPFKRDSQELNLFADLMGGKSGGGKVPGLPKFNPNKVVHASQSIEILKDLPLVSGSGWKYTTRYVAVAQNKSGIIITTESTLVDGQGTAYAKLYSSSFNLGAGNGEKFGKAIAGPPQGKPIPKRDPDFVIKDQTTPEQALVYRLSGDYNPLHIDPAIGKAAGFGGVILHGLSTFGHAARAVLKALSPDDARGLKLFGVRFTSPVKPGDGLETEIWVIGEGPGGTKEIAFQTKNTTTGKVVLGGGVAHVKPSGKGAKL
ncbi:HotDog domain-containing protein [Flagelloscypha sp. PMI_526]|nr:HotDog domain-containing protein [Flagelloscypha sp. PMI_526]